MRHPVGAGEFTDLDRAAAFSYAGSGRKLERAALDGNEMANFPEAGEAGARVFFTMARGLRVLASAYRRTPYKLPGSCTRLVFKKP